MPPGMGPRFLGPPIEIGLIELVYFLLISGISLYIYWKTKEIYDLTRHKGIRHFRNIFLFFALAYAFRLVHIVYMFSRELYGLDFPRVVFPLSLLAVSYLSTMAIFSIIIAMAGTKDEEGIISILLHTIAFLSTLVVLLAQTSMYLVYIQTLIFIASLTYVLWKRRMHLSAQNLVTYISLFTFWVLSTSAISLRFFNFPLKFGLYAISVIIFLSVVIRIRKRLSDEEKGSP